MMKNIFLLLTALLASYMVMYLAEKRSEGNKFQVFAKALALIIAAAGIGILSPAGFAFAIGKISLKLIVLIFSLLASAYFCYYPLGSKRTLTAWIVFMPVFFAVCICGFFQSFNQNNGLISFYMYLSSGLAAGFGLCYLLDISGKNRMLGGQSLAFLLTSYSIYLLMESDWSKEPNRMAAQTLTQQPDAVLWTSLVLTLIAFTCGLFFKSKNKTSC